MKGDVIIGLVTVAIIIGFVLIMLLDAREKMYFKCLPKNHEIAKQACGEDVPELWVGNKRIKFYCSDGREVIVSPNGKE